MLIKFILLNCLLIHVLGDDLIPDLPKVKLPKISIGETEDASKKLKISSQKHLLTAGGLSGIEKKEGNAEKVSNYEKDKGFFFMKAYGWDREKKNEHINAEGKQMKAGKFGKILTTGDKFNKKLKQDNHANDDDHHERDYGSSLYKHGEFSKRMMGFDETPKSNRRYHNQDYKYDQPEVEYTDGHRSYEMIEPKINYYPNKQYSRIHYPISGSYLSTPETNYQSDYNRYKNSKKYPIKKLWNQGYHASKYYSKPITDDNKIENNLIEYYGDHKSKYEPYHFTSHDSYPDYHHSDRYSDDKFDDDEGREYYDRSKISDIEIDKLRSSYSQFNDNYASSQLEPQTERSNIEPQKMHLESATSNEQPVKKQYRLWIGSHYY